MLPHKECNTGPPVVSSPPPLSVEPSKALFPSVSGATSPASTATPTEPTNWLANRSIRLIFANIDSIDFPISSSHSLTLNSTALSCTFYFLRLFAADPTPSSSQLTPHRPPRTMPSRDAVITCHTDKLPTFGEGQVTTLACSKFSDSCYNYFALKETASEKQVGIVLGCFEDMKVNNCSRPAHTQMRLIKLLLPEFMIEFCRKFLHTDWEEELCTEVLTSRMKESQSFDKWVTKLESSCALLTDLKDPAGMVLDLVHLYAESQAKRIEELGNWLAAVANLDEDHVYKNEKFAFFASHCTTNCDGEFPTAKNYHTLTQADVNAVKKDKLKAVVTVMPAIKDGEDSLNSKEGLSHSITKTALQLINNILNPPAPKPALQKPEKLRAKLKGTKDDHAAMVKELSAVCDLRRQDLEARNLFEPVKPVNVIATIHEHIEVLAHWDELSNAGMLFVLNTLYSLNLCPMLTYFWTMFTARSKSGTLR
ncbi:hypothetical protein DFH09DRAFT_1317338 [Mycena vulgaris]|nr:hypothetical protein DFH09DRAFT_1317338 [Mycena vulgaris]